MAEAGPSTSHPATGSSYFDQVSGKWAYEDPATGSTLEWDEQRLVWVPVVEDDLVRAQQAAYSVAGVDEEAPVAGVVSRGSKKRKQDEADTAEPDGSGGAKHASKSKKGGSNNSNGGGAPARQTAVWVSHLPDNTTVALLQSVFSKAGLILEDGNGDPRIKLYYDDAGRFKGDALIVYLQAESVELAVRLLDDSELELGKGKGNMLVKKAEWDKKRDGAEGGPAGQGPQNGAGGGSSRQSEQDKQKAKRRAEKLKKKLEDWSSEDEDAGAAAGRAKYSKIVVLKGMFTLRELEDDPTLLLDLKEEVRDECEKLGEVTNVTLYDLEPEGVMSVRFKTELGAQACIAKNDGRYFGGQNISAFLMDGSMKFRQSGKGVSLAGTGLGGDDELDAAAEEEDRRDKYAAWLEEQGTQEKDT